MSKRLVTGTIKMLIVSTLVLLFLWKLRFPRNTPLSDVLRRRYGHHALQVFRKYEHTSKQLVKKEMDYRYLRSCKTYKVFPKFLRFKLYRKTLQNSKLYKKWMEKLLDIEMKTKEKEISDLKISLSQVSQPLKSTVSRLDFCCLKSFVQRKIAVLKKNVSRIHERKLQNIGGVYNFKSCNPDKVIFNYSNVCLSDRAKFLLSFGLDFCLPVFKLSFHRYFLCFENLVNRLKYCHIAHGLKFESIVNSIKNIAGQNYFGFKSCNVFSPIFTRSDFSVLKNLGSNKDLVVCKPDKGRGVVLLNKPDYISKMNDILNDFTKFTKLHFADIFPLSLKIEDKVIRFLKKLVASKTITEEEYKTLRPTGSSPATLYGLPKVHKPSLPLRPILAAYNTASYKVAKFLVPILSQFTTNAFTVKNSYELTESLSGYQVPNSYFMASFDVKSLFTNVPIDETITICTDNVFKGLSNFMGMTRAVFKNLLSLCVKDTLFIFNDNLYKQIDGVAMGSPLGPTFANIFLCHHEEKWLESCPIHFKPVLYRRYVDDTFIIFKHRSHAPLFLDYFNSRHRNINFTMDEEMNSKLSFLDLTIEKHKDTLLFSIFRKPTFSGLGTSYFSFCNYNFKITAVKTLLHRAYALSSTFSYVHKEMMFLRNFFLNNGYSGQLFDKLLKQFLNDKYQPKQCIPTVNKDVKYFKLPYIGDASSKIQEKLRNVLTKYYPQIEFRFVPVNRFKIGSFFTFKDRLPSDLRSSVVYHYTCPCCQAGYIGCTQRAFKTRTDEHLGQSSRTGQRLCAPPHSAVREHSEMCDTLLKREHFKIIDSCPDNDIRILESLYIHSLKPQLNNTVSSIPLNVV